MAECGAKPVAGSQFPVFGFFNGERVTGNGQQVTRNFYLTNNFRVIENKTL
jgi:hypothetical protein